MRLLLDTPHLRDPLLAVSGGRRHELLFQHLAAHGGDGRVVLEVAARLVLLGHDVEQLRGQVDGDRLRLVLELAVRVFILWWRLQLQ